MTSPVVALEQRLFVALRRVLAWRIRDITAQISGRSALVLAPHPDDETLGCGATILRKTDAGQRVHVVIVTDGAGSHESKVISREQLVELRRREVYEACRRLGVPSSSVTLLGIPDGHTQQHAAEVLRRLVKIVDEFAPDELYAPSREDRHPDHRALGQIAAELVEKEHVGLPLHEYPVWSWEVDGLVPRSDSAVGRVAALRDAARAALTFSIDGVSTDGCLERKRSALDAHRTQMTNMSGEPSWTTLPGPFVRSFFGRYELFVSRTKHGDGR